MPSAPARASFVLFDLSHLDAPSASAYLDELTSRGGTGGLPEGAVCHWLVSGARGFDLAALSGRLAAGDRLLVTNPSGLDWSTLYPAEAEAELAAAAASDPPASLFLTSTPRLPSWFRPGERPVFVSRPDGLHRVGGDGRFHLPWARPGTGSGVWWIVPGQGVFSAWPPLPWGDLLGPLGRPAGARRSGSAIAPDLGMAAKAALYQTAEQRRNPEHPSVRAGWLRAPEEFPGLGTREAVDFEESLGGVRKRALVANMQGQTTLGDAEFQVRFVGGRLTSIGRRGEPKLWCRGASTWLDWGRGRRAFSVNSAFSLEGDFSWGLRQSLVLDDPDLKEPARALIDYYFVEESRDFFVAVTVRWPRWHRPATVRAWAPLDLRLFAWPWTQSLTTREQWPQGERRDTLRRRVGAGVLEGTDFVLSAGRTGLVLGFPQNQTPRPHRLPWGVRTGWGGRWLSVWPEGGRGPLPSGELEGREEHFSFYLSPAEGARLPFTVTRKQAAELIPPYLDTPAPLR